jgi:phage-related minor tail protein
MARGAGLMGEAGPEAVLPLKRLPSGNLGVESGGRQPVVVNIINNANAKVTTEERDDRQGGIEMNVMIDALEQQMAQRQARPGSALNKSLKAAQSPLRAR